VIRCEEIIKDDAGNIVELRCTYDPETRGGATPDGRTVKGTLHWVSEPHAVPCEVRLYDRLFTTPDPEADAETDADFLRHVNPDSLQVKRNARIEPAAANLEPGTHVQFERLGYFIVDPDRAPDAPVFNRTVTLRDTWARMSGKETGSSGRPDRSAPAREPVRDRSREGAAAEAGPPSDLTTRDAAAAKLLADAVAAGADADAASNWINNDLARELAGSEATVLKFGGPELARLLELLATDVLSSSGARTALAEMVQSGGAPDAIVERRNLAQISSTAALDDVVSATLAAHPDKVAEYRGGRTGLLGFFVGQVMKKSQGRANPEVASTLLRERLDEGAQ
jgi:glutaminyl-tRNA synthetase